MNRIDWGWVQLGMLKFMQKVPIYGLNVTVLVDEVRRLVNAQLKPKKRRPRAK